MKIVEYYKKPERRMAGVVVAFCLIVIAVLFILKTIGFGTGLIFPDWLCHVLWLGGSWALLCVIAAMFLYPLRYFIPFREKSLAEAFEAGFKTLFALLFVAFGVLFLFGDVVGMIEDGEKRYQNGGTDYRRYSCYEELPQDEFSDLLVPRDAVDIRRIYDGGFKYLNCSFSSEIDIKVARAADEASLFQSVLVLFGRQLPNFTCSILWLRVVEGGGEPSLAVGEKGGEGLGECAGRALDDRTVVRGG